MALVKKSMKIYVRNKMVEIVASKKNKNLFQSSNFYRFFLHKKISNYRVLQMHVKAVLDKLINGNLLYKKKISWEG